MITPHPTLSYTAKAHLTGCQMNNSIIDTTAAKAQRMQNALFYCFSARE